MPQTITLGYKALCEAAEREIELFGRAFGRELRIR